eukprot:scaffold8505_cov130-Cylindrotheca_fusiformis.AAC.18
MTSSFLRSIASGSNHVAPGHNQRQSLVAFDIQSHRRADEVERVGNSECRVTTSMITDYSLGKVGGGTSFPKGIMTTFQASRKIELLTLELNVLPDAASGSVVEVYYKEGSWSGEVNDSSQWTKLAKTKTMLAPDDKGAIIPTSEFKSVVIQPNVEYSLYVHSEQRNFLRVKDVKSGLIGDEMDSDDVITSFLGVPLKDGPFKDADLSDIAAFEGVFHYLEVQPCSEAATTSNVLLEFAIDSDPVEEVMDELSGLVVTAMEALMVSEPLLIEYQGTHLLRLDSVETNFEGRSGKCWWHRINVDAGVHLNLCLSFFHCNVPEKCPSHFSKCSVVHSVVAFNHLHSISQGRLQMNILQMSNKIVDPITDQMSKVETQYIGDSVIQASLGFLLNGMDQTKEFNKNQKRYFERVISGFLSNFEEPIVYSADVTFVEQLDGQRRRELGRSSLRGRQLEGTTRVIASLYGSGVASEFRPQIIENIVSDGGRLVNDLRLQHLRPGEINKSNSGDIFDDISSIQISTDLRTSTDSPGNDGPNPTSPPLGSDTKEDGIAFWVPILLFLVLFVGGFLFYHTYGKKLLYRLRGGKFVDTKLLNRQRSPEEQRDRARQLQEHLQGVRPSLHSPKASNDLSSVKSSKSPEGGGDELWKPTRTNSASELRRVLFYQELDRKKRALEEANNKAAENRPGIARANSAPFLQVLQQDWANDVNAGVGNSYSNSPKDRSSRRSGIKRSSSSDDIMGRKAKGADKTKRASRSLSRDRAVTAIATWKDRVSNSINGIGQTTRTHLENLGLVEGHRDQVSDGSDGSSSVESDFESDAEMGVVNVRPRRTASGGELDRMRQHLKAKNSRLVPPTPPCRSSSGGELHQMREKFQQRKKIGAATPPRRSASGSELHQMRQNLKQQKSNRSNQTRSSRSLSRDRVHNRFNLKDNLDKSVAEIADKRRAHLQQAGLVGEHSEDSSSSESECESECESGAEADVIKARPVRTSSGGELHQMRQRSGTAAPPRRCLSGSELHQTRPKLNRRSYSTRTMHGKGVTKQPVRAASFRHANRANEAPGSNRSPSLDKVPSKPRRTRSGNSLERMAVPANGVRSLKAQSSTRELNRNGSRVKSESDSSHSISPKARSDMSNSKHDLTPHKKREIKKKPKNSGKPRDAGSSHSQTNRDDGSTNDLSDS